MRRDKQLNKCYKNKWNKIRNVARYLPHVPDTRSTTDTDLQHPATAPSSSSLSRIKCAKAT